MSDPKAIIMAYQEAHNNQDIEQTLRLFSPNIRFEMAGIWVREGLEEMRQLEEWDRVMSSRLAFGAIKKRGGRLVCSAEETSTWLSMVGIEAVLYDSVMFEFAGSQINRIRAKLAPKSEMAIDKAVNRVMRWALEARPDEIGEIIPRGLFNYGQVQAEKWLALLEEWQQRAVESEE